MRSFERLIPKQDGDDMQRKWSHNAKPHRKLQMAPHFDNPQKGADVQALQRAINKRLAARKLPGKLATDGECGRHTIARGRLAARALGIGLKGDGLPIYVQQLIIDPARRTPAQIKRGKAWVKESAPKPSAKVRANTVTGGTDRERLATALTAAAEAYYAGRSHRFYSQAGAWTVDYAITGEPHGYRSDCSQFATSIFHSCGLDDPNRNNYTGGFTGTLARGRRIRREDLRPGDFILYGTAPFHHVEVYLGDGIHRWAEADPHVRDRTVGHGSPPVDYGDIDMIAGANFVRAFGLS